MRKYYIQYATDFHLLSSLASIRSFSGRNVVLIGPATKMSSLIARRMAASCIVTDPRAPKLNILKTLFLLFRSRICRDSVIVSPFVFPLYTFLLLLKEGRFVVNMIRTDEGVGSYASVRHYYASFKMERPGREVSSAIKAVVKRVSVLVTKFLGICREEYIFNSDLTFDKDRVGRLRDGIDRLGRLEGIDGKVVYVSQPGASKGFESQDDYVQFLRFLGEKLGSGKLVVKRHPSDFFDYARYGFEVLEGFPLELYHTEKSVVIGFSSTALLMAKILGRCEKVYYIKKKGAGPFYDNLSPVNKQLFDLYLTPFEGLC